MQNRLKRATIGGHSYLTFKLDGSMVPWDPGIVEKIRSLAATPADGDKLIEHLKKTTLVVSLGLHDDYLLLAIGPSTDVLSKMGKARRCVRCRNWRPWPSSPTSGSAPSAT